MRAPGAQAYTNKKYIHTYCYGFDHINRNAPVLIRTPKLTRFEPAQYWGGGPPGNSVVLNPFFLVLGILVFLVFLVFGVRLVRQVSCITGSTCSVSCDYRIHL
jgi:hypothetical protein